MKEHKCFKLLFDLFFTLFKIGFVAFGGGYAIVALLENELISKKKWSTQDEFLDMVGIAESTPGPIAINSATYIGYKKAGVLGSFMATLGVCTPCFILMYIVSIFYNEFMTNAYISAAFSGIQVCVIYLIAMAGIKMIKNIKRNMFSIVALIATIVCIVATNIYDVAISSIWYIVIGGFLGVFLNTMSNILRKERK
jgi:chromate transporter